MEKNYFNLEDKIEEIKTNFVQKNGWIKIYESQNDEDDSSGIYCCLVSNKQLESYNQDYHWPLHIGSEGKPSVFGDNSYQTYSEEGLEPFLFYKSFSLIEKSVSYIDIAEEFVLYFKLYETGSDKQNRIFHYVDDYGELDEVIIIEPKSIRVKLKYLKEYISIREMHFVICYDFMRLQRNIPNDWEIQYCDKLVKEPKYIFSHLIRNVDDRTQSWIFGKNFIEPNPEKKTHFDLNNYKYEDFIIGYDENGELKYEKCNAENIHFTLTYFKKEVLEKYYNHPEFYEIDSFSVSSKFFRLKIDNNKRGYVPVFLRDLRILSHKEQLHWKHYNIAPQEGMNISGTYYKTMIEGQWAEKPEAIDLFFKSKYEEFNNKWKNKFGWNLYKPLSTKDKYLFTSLHSITNNNIKSFCEQTLTIVKLTIDRINEKEIIKDLSIEPKIKGIGKFEKYLESNDIKSPDMFEFLRNLQNLRSGLIAHSFSESNKDCQRAIKYFNLDSGNYTEILDDIFKKSIFTLNMLEKYFVL